MQQLAGGVIDEDEQGAFGTAILEPPMMRAVDLHELAQAIAATAWLVKPALPLST